MNTKEDQFWALAEELGYTHFTNDGRLRIKDYTSKLLPSSFLELRHHPKVRDCEECRTSQPRCDCGAGYYVRKK